MQLGLVGLPRSGKTTLFGALTGQAPNPNTPGRELQKAVVKVPDPRIDRLSEIFQPRKTTYAEVVFVDLAVEVGPREGRAPLSEAVAAELRNVDALVHVVRAFSDPSVPRPPGSTDPSTDLQMIEQELILRDLAIVEKRQERLHKEGNRPENKIERALLDQVQAELDAGRPLRGWSGPEREGGILRGFQFLSQKPLLIVFNVGDENVGSGARALAEVPDQPEALRLCAKLELEIGQLPAGDRQEFLDELGLERPALDVFLRRAHELLELLSFFTVGEDEVRSWPVRRGATALVAAGKIHSDIQKGFIRAESIHYDDFVRLGSLNAAKTEGKLRLEGKEYPVQDGDILHFRFNV